MRLSAQTEGKRSRQRNMDAKVLVIPRRNEEDEGFFATNPRELRKICNLPSFLWSDSSLLRQILNVLKEPITHVERRRKREGRESGLFSDHSRKKGFPFLSSLFVLLSVFLEGPCEKDGWGEKTPFSRETKGRVRKRPFKIKFARILAQRKIGEKKRSQKWTFGQFSHLSRSMHFGGQKLD